MSGTANIDQCCRVLVKHPELMGEIVEFNYDLKQLIQCFNVNHLYYLIDLLIEQLIIQNDIHKFKLNIKNLENKVFKHINKYKDLANFNKYFEAIIDKTQFKIYITSIVNYYLEIKNYDKLSYYFNTYKIEKPFINNYINSIQMLMQKILDAQNVDLIINYFEHISNYTVVIRKIETIDKLKILDKNQFDYLVNNHLIFSKNLITELYGSVDESVIIKTLDEDFDDFIDNKTIEFIEKYYPNYINTIIDISIIPNNFEMIDNIEIFISKIIVRENVFNYKIFDYINKHKEYFINNILCKDLEFVLFLVKVILKENDCYIILYEWFRNWYFINGSVFTDKIINYLCLNNGICLLSMILTQNKFLIIDRKFLFENYDKFNTRIQKMIDPYMSSKNTKNARN